MITNNSLITIPLSQTANSAQSQSGPALPGVTTRLGAQRAASNAASSQNRQKPPLVDDARSDTRQTERKGPSSYHEPELNDGQSSSG